MAQQVSFGILVLLACFCFEASSKPTNNEVPTAVRVEVPIEDLLPQNEDQNEEKSFTEEETVPEIQEENTQEILEKIKAINDKLRRPQRQQLNFNGPLYNGGPYILDKAILEKIQQIIASGKLHGAQKEQEKAQENNSVEGIREGTPRALQFVQPELTSNALSGQAVAIVPLPYMVNMPVLVTPSPLTGYSANNGLNSIETTPQYSTRQRPSLPFQIQWPLAQYFPVLIKDPFLHYLQGGTWQTLVDYGQNADVCNRKQKSTETEVDSNNEKAIEENNDDTQLYDTISLNPTNSGSSRQGRKLKNIKKRTVSKTTPMKNLNDPKSIQNVKASALQNLNDVKHLQKLFLKQTTPKPVKKAEPIQNVDREEGDLRFPFGDYTFFGNRKPVAPSPGFFINRLKVRRGGVAIAGPGGVATAGRGGTAVVGPGGLAYTQPGGLAVAGPAARVVALSSDADLNSVITRLQQQASTDGSVPRLLEAIPEGKVVATGPVVYYHPYKL